MGGPPGGDHSAFGAGALLDVGNHISDADAVRAVHDERHLPGLREVIGDFYRRLLLHPSGHGRHRLIAEVGENMESGQLRHGRFVAARFGNTQAERPRFDGIECEPALVVKNWRRQPMIGGAVERFRRRRLRSQIGQHRMKRHHHHNSEGAEILERLACLRLARFDGRRLGDVTVPRMLRPRMLRLRTLKHGRPASHAYERGGKR